MQDVSHSREHLVGHQKIFNTDQQGVSSETHSPAATRLLRSLYIYCLLTFTMLMRHLLLLQKHVRTFSKASVVPLVPLEAKPVQCTESVKLDQSSVELLERLSLVDFSNAEAVTRLEEAVKFASVIMTVDTTDVAPMVSPLEDMPLLLREDVAKECSSEDMLKNARKTEEGYFVAPPGNIPLEPKANYALHDSTKDA